MNAGIFDFAIVISTLVGMYRYDFKRKNNKGEN